MASASRTDLRWLCLVLATLAALAFVNGLRAARDRQRMLLPERLAEVVSLPRAETLTVEAGSAAALLLELPTADDGRRLVLHQIFPERRLLRWLETPGHSGRYLHLPLAGLDPGEYWLGESPDDATAGPQEMDRPVEEFPVLLRFRLLSATGRATD